MKFANRSIHADPKYKQGIDVFTPKKLVFLFSNLERITNREYLRRKPHTPKQTT